MARCARRLQSRRGTVREVPGRGDPQRGIPVDPRLGNEVRVPEVRSLGGDGKRLPRVCRRRGPYVSVRLYIFMYIYIYIYIYTFV